MFAPRTHEKKFLYLFRWTARFLGAFGLGVLLLFLFGEDFDLAAISANDLVGLLFFPLAVIAGLVLAWHEEFTGGLLAVAGVVGFYIVYGLLLNGSLRMGWWFVLFAIPGLLFMLYGILSAERTGAAGERNRGRPVKI